MVPVVRAEPEPGKVYPRVSIRALRWTCHDELAQRLEPGRVLRLEVIARVDELREVKAGREWNVEVLEVVEASE